MLNGLQHFWSRLTRRFLGFKRLFLFSLIACLGLNFYPVGWTQTTADTVILQGLEFYHQGDLSGAIEQWQQRLQRYPLPMGQGQDQGRLGQAPDSEPAETLQSVAALKYLARAQQQLGQVSEAMLSLQRLADYYRNTGETRSLGQILIEQAQLYGELGQPQNAIALLCGETTPLNCDGDGALSLIQRQADATDPLSEIAALGVLGQTYYTQGEYKVALDTLKASLALAEAHDQVPYTLAASNTLGNVYIGLSQRNFRYAQFARQSQDLEDVARFENKARQYDHKAIDYFTRSLALAQSQGDTVNILRSQLNLVLPLARTTEQSGESLALFNQAREQLNLLPDTREKAYSAIRLANLLAQISGPETGRLDLSQCVPLQRPSVALLQRAVTIAQRIQDSVAEAYAVGELGHLYECEADYPTAMQLTERAQLLASQPESRYLWEWQAGRILNAQGKPAEAVLAYQQTVKTLQGIQGDIAIANRDLRLDFRDAVEVIYRQLTELQLEQATRRSTKQSSQSTVLSALQTLDGLRLAELRNYLGSECDLPSVVAQSSLDQASAFNATTASISTLILKDRLAVILALPTADGQIQTLLHDVPLNPTQLRAQVNEFRYLLEQRADRANRFLPQSQQFYDWLIRPFESALADHQIQTLVFNHDGILRTIPMAALQDGQQYLVQTYAITNSLSFARTPTPTLPAQSMQVLAFGLTKSAKVTSNEQFPPLTAVKEEITQIEKTLPGSRIFFDEEFTQNRLQNSLSESAASILHLATHAKFGYDSSETFLVTGEQIQAPDTAETYNRPLRMNELYRLIRKVESRRAPLRLLTLTACETATGSERDALGLAGVAVQAGVESAVASLWQVEDQATAALITRFYGHLREGLGRSAALQQTQRDWLATHRDRYSHPGYWAVLTLIDSGRYSSL